MGMHVLKCPQCNGPIKPSRFARTVECPYCGAVIRLDEAAVEAAVFHKAFQKWNQPESHGFDSYFTVGGMRWSLGRMVARGEISDLYRAQRARVPTEAVLSKFLRSGGKSIFFEREWKVLQKLWSGEISGVASLGKRIPQPVCRGKVDGSAYSGTESMVFRWAWGFSHDFDSVHGFFPEGIPPRIAVWMWRRILETLAFLHSGGFVHGAVIPPHLLVEEKEHGIRMVGFGRAGKIGGSIEALPEGFESYQCEGARTLKPVIDLVMSARSMIFVLGGDLEEKTLPESVPESLRETLWRISALRAGIDAWKLREELGRLAEKEFGPPEYCPLKITKGRT